MSKSHVLALGVAVLLTAIVVAQDTAATKSQPQPCSAPEQEQMDFWLGDWDLTWPGNSSVGAGHGTNSIKRILDGCIVEENFSGGESMHLRGRSVSVFDARAGKRVMSRLKAVYRSWAIPCAGRDVYYTRHRAEWLGKIKHAGVRRRADQLYQHLDVLQGLRQQVRRELLAESRKHPATAKLRQIPYLGPIRSALLVVKSPCYLR